MFDGAVRSEYITEVRTAGDGKDFKHELAEHEVLDRRLRTYASQRAALDAAESFDLVRAFDLRIHIVFGCATFLEYMERRLGYTPHTARERLRVARALVSLPVTAAALAREALTYSHVRELTRVATPDTEQAWVASAVEKTSTEVEEQVAGRAPGDLPSDPERPNLRPVGVHVKLPTDVFALWREARRGLAEERGGEVSDADLMETLCRRLLDPGTGVEGPAHQIAYKQCPGCRRATVNGAGRELDIASPVFERAACDARNLGDLDEARPQRATTTVTPRMREQVFARDGHRCVVPGCRAARNLCIHHLIAQCDGGPHELWNCVLLCSGHHAALHDGLLVISGRAPHDLAFRWTYGPPSRPGATPAERRAALRDRAAIAFGEPLDPPELEIPTRVRSRRAG
jgi:hypothetical protein